MNKRRVYQIAGGVVLALAIFVAYHSLQLRYMTSLGPGPGFFPLWLSLVLGGLALMMIFDGTFRCLGTMATDFLPDREGSLRILIILVVLVGAALCLEPLGFSLTMFLVTMVIVTAFGRRRPLGMLAVAIPLSFGVYYAFTRWLNVPLPEGPFGLPLGL